MKIAHGTSDEQAAERLRAEVPAWDFDGVHKAARDTWAQLLNRVRVTAGTDKPRKLFYSTLSQSFASPRLIAAKGAKFADTNGKIHTPTHHRYGPAPCVGTWGSEARGREHNYVRQRRSPEEAE